MLRLKRIVAFMLGVVKLIVTPGKSKATIYHTIESIQQAKEKQLSIIRFGDGEYRIIVRKKDIHYQKYDPSLRKEMLEMIQSYHKDSKYLICIPRAVIAENASWFFKHDIKYFTHFIDFRFYFRFHMNQKNQYGDAMMFACGNEPYYQEIWKEAEKVIFVHNDKKWADNFENKYDIPTTFIAVPNKDSYDSIERIEQEIIHQVGMMSSQKYAILLSAGPTAKCLVYRLSQKNIIAYDCGHCWDDPLIFED